jgi:hypothetical protein
MRQREPVAWDLVIMLDTSINPRDPEDTDRRLFKLRVQLEALLRHPDVVVAVARKMHEQFVAAAPDVPTLTVAQQER